MARSILIGQLCGSCRFIESRGPALLETRKIHAFDGRWLGLRSNHSPCVFAWVFTHSPVHTGRSLLAGSTHVILVLRRWRWRE